MTPDERPLTYAEAHDLVEEAARVLAPVSEACAAGRHEVCRHPANRRRYDGCQCQCHGGTR